MGTSYTFLPDGVLTATNLNERSKAIERHLNGEIISSDIQEKHITSATIKPPRFFGSPAPRSEFVSSDIHYRSTPHESTEAFVLWDAVSTDYEPIPGLATSIHLHPQNPESDFVSVHVMTSFYCRDINEDQNKSTATTAPFSVPGNGTCATFALFHQHQDTSVPSMVPGTKRKLFQAGTFESRIPSQNMGICANIALRKGVNHIFIGVQIGDDKFSGWRVHVFNRNMIVDVHYL